MSKLKIVIVTPETTTLDQEADFVVLPMFDGESGVSANHAPMIGRLGPGELRVKDGGTTQSFYVDGGFVQVEDNVVSVLTGSSTPAGDIDVAEAKAALDAANELSSQNVTLADVKQKAVSQARAKIRVAEKA
ncbi:ATP synthase F1 subunit epsilon [Mariniblastus fucicola]|uniref:ATP synthase epsilon chain n=1 Tax=Mariniblastus fucicola TaxID=980251 RepID=A0A5B9PI94_9BACT|nr:ATP synthase F1 subunit epsilon [Mariniblastus fucicola]QEG24392.1 ATP synthase epsilon chain, sodium ion specific [Mariniblastus fucicola]